MCPVLEFVTFVSPWLQFTSPWLSNPNIGARHLLARNNTHELPPEKRPGKELPAEGSSQAVRGQVFATARTTMVKSLLLLKQPFKPHTYPK
jgi:hypothetical protein